MKILGAIFVILSCTLAGFYKCGKIEREEEYVKDLMSALLYIKKQLSLSRSLMSELMEGAAELGGAAAEIFSDCARLLGGGSITFCEAWESAVNKSGICDKRTKQILFELGAQLGKNDVEGELATVTEAEGKLSVLYEDMRGKAEKEGSLYKKAGVLLGVVITILLY